VKHQLPLSLHIFQPHFLPYAMMIIRDTIKAYKLRKTRS